MSESLWDPALPVMNPDTEEWWEATRRRRLLLQRCAGCAHVQHYPRSVCTRCGHARLGWIEASGRGTVYSFSEVMRSPDPERFTTPYTVALVRLEEGVLIFARLTERADWSCDQEVQVDWFPLSDGRHLPIFGPATANSREVSP